MKMQMQILNGLGRKLAFVFLLFAAMVGQAQAANTWLPAFDPSVHVYTDPELGNSLGLDDNFVAQVQQQAAVNNLQVYIVSALQGDDLSGNRSNWAPSMLHNQLWNQWASTPGFNSNRTLVILYIRSQGATTGSIAVRSGEYLHGLGLGEDLFSSASGPVLPAARQYMSSSPQTGFLSILAAINQTVADKSAHPGGSSGLWFGWSLLTWIIVGIIIFVVLLIILSLIFGGGGGGGSGGSFIFFGGSCSSGGGSSGGSSCSSGSSCGGGGSC